MKKRSIAEVHSKEYGFKPFAKFLDLAIEKNHSIDEIEEGYEKFKFKMDGVSLEYDKNLKNPKEFLEYCEGYISMFKKINNK